MVDIFYLQCYIKKAFEERSENMIKFRYAKNNYDNSEMGLYSHNF